jgi:hypothetical protein
MLGPLSTVLLRLPAPAYQAECRGFETRLPLHFPFRAQHDTQPVILLPERLRWGCYNARPGKARYRTRRAKTRPPSWNPRWARVPTGPDPPEPGRGLSL